jgi:hypothetical protein
LGSRQGRKCHLFVSILYCPTLNAGTLSVGLSLCPSVQDSKVGPSMIINGQTIGIQKESMKGWWMG